MRIRKSGRILPALLIVASAFAGWSALSVRHANASEPPYFAIRNARIVPVSGPVIENGTVVIAKGLIQAVGATATIPPEAEIIDGSGMTVYPGLIDAGTDVGLGATAQPAAAAGRGGGGGGGRGAATNAPLSMGPEDRPATTPWVEAADELKSDDARIASWREAGFTTALVLPRAGIFPGQGSIVDLRGSDLPGERVDEMVVKTPAALPINFAGGRGLYQGFPSALMGQLAYVHQVFLDAQWYANAKKVYDAHPEGIARPAYDRTDMLIEQVIADKELVLVPGNTDVDIERALKLAPQWDVKWALYGAQQGYAVPADIAAAHVPVIVNLDWPERDRDADEYAIRHEQLRTLRFRDRAPGTPAALAKAGVKFAFATESSANAADILRNINKSIAAGLAPEAALKALTLDAAEILGVGAQLGSIQPGKIANLVVTSGDLFKEGTAVKWVFVDGERYEVRPKPPEPGGGGGRGRGGANPMQEITSQPGGEVRQ
ncbi:MAG TPA: amidohydrolase family protein [Candidatus Acidoferrales bacterium]|nr:amidohydrolase family protein [Candidatus Acidoferrales bacterium]